MVNRDTNPRPNKKALSTFLPEKIMGDAFVALFEVSKEDPTNLPWLRRRSFRTAWRQTASVVDLRGAILRNGLMSQEDPHLRHMLDKCFERTRAVD